MEHKPENMQQKDQFIPNSNAMPQTYPQQTYQHGMNQNMPQFNPYMHQYNMYMNAAYHQNMAYQNYQFQQNMQQQYSYPTHPPQQMPSAQYPNPLLNTNLQNANAEKEKETK